jgi:hypothetical protein
MKYKELLARKNNEKEFNEVLLNRQVRAAEGRFAKKRVDLQTEVDQIEEDIEAESEANNIDPTHFLKLHEQLAIAKKRLATFKRVQNGLF